MRFAEHYLLYLSSCYEGYVFHTRHYVIVPDIWRAYDNPPDGVPMWTGYFLIVSLVLFSCLQFYWGVLVARQVKKAFSGDGGAKEKKR
jgi:hypothetical protein